MTTKSVTVISKKKNDKKVYKTVSVTDARSDEDFSQELFSILLPIEGWGCGM